MVLLTFIFLFSWVFDIGGYNLMDFNISVVLNIEFFHKLYTVTCQINVNNVGNSIDFNVFPCSQEKIILPLTVNLFSCFWCHLKGQ